MLSTCAMFHNWAEQDEGPYHRDLQPLRRDVVEDRDGVLLQLGVRLAHADARPAHDAVVEIWQCDALGRYSGFPLPDDSIMVSAAEAPRGEYLPNQTFLRGRQATDAAGMVEFRTIYPGWYPGRTVHIHVMVHVGATTLISQLYFPEDVTAAVFDTAPYSERPGSDTTNATDEILPTGGSPAILDITSTDVGYRAAVCLVLPAIAVSY